MSNWGPYLSHSPALNPLSSFYSENTTSCLSPLLTSLVLLVSPVPPLSLYKQPSFSTEFARLSDHPNKLFSLTVCFLDLILGFLTCFLDIRLPQPFLETVSYSLYDFLVTDLRSAYQISSLASGPLNTLIILIKFCDSSDLSVSPASLSRLWLLVFWIVDCDF